MVRELPPVRSKFAAHTRQEYLHRQLSCSAGLQGNRVSQTVSGPRNLMTRQPISRPRWAAAMMATSGFRVSGSPSAIECRLSVPRDVPSSVPPAQYSGASSLNFTMKSGGLQFHDGANDFVHNTIFDAWLFSQEEATYKTATGATIPTPKNIEHQNELSIYGGGYIPIRRRSSSSLLPTINFTRAKVSLRIRPQFLQP
jgi:hypothetical protein